MSAKTMNYIQKKENPNDIVYTPQKIVDIMIEDLDINDSVLDCCYGKGVFYNSFKNKINIIARLQKIKIFLILIIM